VVDWNVKNLAVGQEPADRIVNSHVVYSSIAEGVVADPELEDLQSRIDGPPSDPDPVVSDENTKRYFEVLKRFVKDATNAKDAGIPGAAEFWDKIHIGEIAEAIESAETITNPLVKAASIGAAVGSAAMQCGRQGANQFTAVRAATAAGAPGEHANPDFAGAAASGLGQAPGQWWDQARLSLSNAVDAFSFKAPFMRFKYKITHHDYPGAAEDALNYFIQAKKYYDMFGR
jgi:hypothetical protein